MKLENQVVSLELAKQLKELGVKQESIWCWTEFWGDKWEITFKDFAKLTQTGNVSAFTVAELGEMLCPGMTQQFKKNDWHEDAVDVSFTTTVMPQWEQDEMRYSLVLGAHMWFVHDKSEANARAKALIYLIQEGHVDPNLISS
jgi:hypothetical protein